MRGIKRLFKEPLLFFLLLGAVIFAGYNALADGAAGARLYVTDPLPAVNARPLRCDGYGAAHAAGSAADGVIKGSSYTTIARGY